MNFIRRHLFPSFAITSMLSIILVAFLVGLVIRRTTNRVEVQACHRLNVERARNNRDWHQTYLFDKLFEDLINASLSKQTGSTPRTPEQQRQTQLFLGRLDTNVKALQWIPLTNCHNAVYISGYQPPEPIAFTEREPPYQSLYPGRGA